MFRQKLRHIKIADYQHQTEAVIGNILIRLNVTKTVKDTFHVLGIVVPMVLVTILL